MAVTQKEVVHRHSNVRQLHTSQSAAGTDAAIIADPGDTYRICIESISCSLAVAGSIALTDGTDTLWALDLGAGVPYAYKGQVGRRPFLEVTPSSPLTLVTTGGAAELTLWYKVIQY